MTAAAAFFPRIGRVDRDGIAAVGRDGIGAVKEQARVVIEFAQVGRIKHILTVDDGGAVLFYDELVEGIPAIGLSGIDHEVAAPGGVVGDRTGEADRVQDLVHGGADEIVGL